jgi:hypothetical protein
MLTSPFGNQNQGGPFRPARVRTWRELCNNHAIALNTEDNPNRRTFFWGIVLAWTPIALFVLGIVRAMLEMSRQRTSGLGPVAGGVSEVLVTYGLLVALASQILAVVLIVRTFTS